MRAIVIRKLRSILHVEHINCALIMKSFKDQLKDLSDGGATLLQGFLTEKQKKLKQKFENEGHLRIVSRNSSNMIQFHLIILGVFTFTDDEKINTELSKDAANFIYNTNKEVMIYNLISTSEAKVLDDLHKLWFTYRDDVKHKPTEILGDAIMLSLPFGSESLKKAVKEIISYLTTQRKSTDIESPTADSVTSALIK